MNNKQKICTKCGVEKNLGEYSPDKRNKDGKSSWCKLCYKKHRDEHKKEISIEQKEYYNRSPWKRTHYAIKTRCNNLNNKDYKNYGGRGIKCLITIDELKFLWFRDKAYLMEKPSIDRKDNNGDYTLDNCEYIEKKINNIKDRYKSINQYDLQRNFIKTWIGAIKIENILGFAQSNISACCLGKRKTAYGFIWKFKTKEK